MLPHSVITVSLGTAYFTRMSTDIRDGRWDRLGTDIRESLSRISLFMVISAGVLWLTSPYVAGVFADQAGTGMASVIGFFAIGLVPFGVVFVLQRILYALEDTRTPFFIQLVQSAVFAVGAIVVGMGPVSEIANGIALSMSVSVFVQAILMVVAVRRRLGRLGGRALVLAFARFGGAVIPALGVGFLIRDALGNTGGSLVADIAFAGIVGLAMGLVYQGILLLLKDPSANDLVAPLRRRGNIRP
jgi:putative peptidoglycan lipid II flippase